jgi:hypothetical protein
MRREAAHHFSIFGNPEIAVFLSAENAVIFRTYRNKGFKYRPGSLRRGVITILGRRYPLTTKELAGCLYFHGGPVARPAWRTPSRSELQATYRAIRHLVAAGKIEFVGKARRSLGRRVHKQYQLAKPGVSR